MRRVKNVVPTIAGSVYHAALSPKNSSMAAPLPHGNRPHYRRFWGSARGVDWGILLAAFNAPDRVWTPDSGAALGVPLQEAGEVGDVQDGGRGAVVAVGVRVARGVLLEEAGEV